MRAVDTLMVAATALGMGGAPGSLGPSDVPAFAVGFVAALSHGFMAGGR